ncbi:T9SS type A sorting domain-containing protein [Aestuariibaculum sp. YM273]|uniref:T9SS type A sorting domain-containing protein n=1 Tax=Aestuariibaculum sp. YM273 TaxID=3070659 RepID=UPI0027DAD7BA|nr:T9SS type A sorting domain-containing protein [Aestuariibaculum sp. YM273]WMI65160.1 T9SS type A sorting domain-containing protein [Aestuariibaculum sp. YM273]
MKKITFLLFMLLFALTSSQLMAQKNVLYILSEGVKIYNDNQVPGTGYGTNAPDTSFGITTKSSLLYNDPVSRMLKGDSNFNVVTIIAQNGSAASSPDAYVVALDGSVPAGNSMAVGTTIDQTGFDLIVVTENVATYNFLKPASVSGAPTDGALTPVNIQAPIIYGKMLHFRNNNLITSAAAKDTRTQNLSMSVVDASSPLFSGLGVSNGSDIPLFLTTSDDFGQAGGYRSVDIINNIEITSDGSSPVTNTLMATVDEITTPDQGIGVNYFPAGTHLGTDASGVLAQDAVTLPFSWGASVKQDGGNITSENLTIWRNAAYMLTGLTVPGTMVSNPAAANYEVVNATYYHDFRGGSATSFLGNVSTDGTLLEDISRLSNVNGIELNDLNSHPTGRFHSDGDNPLSPSIGYVQIRNFVGNGDNFYNSTLGVNLKAGSEFHIKTLSGGKVTVPLMAESTLDYIVSAPNFNNKGWGVMDGTSLVGPSTVAYNETIDGSRGTDFTFEYYGNPGGIDFKFVVDGTNGGTDMYLPYIQVDYNLLQIKPKQVLYLNNANSSSEGGLVSAPGDDAITRMLNADPNFTVTTGTIDGSGNIFPSDLSSFELIIVQEDVSSSSPAFKSFNDGPLALRNLPAPVIFCKSESFVNDKITLTSAAVRNTVSDISVTVPLANQSNPMFSGIDFSGGDDIRLFYTATNGNGTDSGNSALKVITGIEMNNAAAATLATTPVVTDVESSIVINHIPTGTQLGTAGQDVTVEDIVVFAFTHGAQRKGDGTNVTSELLTIWRNAAYMLTGRAVPTSPYVNEQEPKLILYANKAGKTPGAGASALNNDPIIRMLNADPNFFVEYVESDATGSAIPDVSGYDLVIAQESFGSGDDVFKPGGVFGVRDITTPIIYNKSWAFRSGRAITDADASVEATQNVSVTAVNTNHPLLKGIDFSGGNDIRIFSEATADDASGNYGGTGGNKAIDALINIDLTGGLSASAVTVPEATDAASSMIVNYLASGTQIGEDPNDVLGVNAVTFGWSHAAMIMGDGANISPEALTIWRNAVYALIFGLSEIPDTLVENADFTLSIDKAGEVSEVMTSVRAIGNNIHVSNVQSPTEVKIYSLTGALVKSFKTNEDVSFSFRSGIYIATVKTFEGAKAVKLLVK